VFHACDNLHWEVVNPDALRDAEADFIDFAVGVKDGRSVAIICAAATTTPRRHARRRADILFLATEGSCLTGVVGLGLRGQLSILSDKLLDVLVIEDDNPRR